MSGIRDPEQISPRIYIHVTTSENETRARAVARQLQQAGFIVPSIQRVAAVPSTPQLRYFRPADVKDAERAITVIRQQIPSLKAVEFENQDLTRKDLRHAPPAPGAVVLGAPGGAGNCCRMIDRSEDS